MMLTGDNAGTAKRIAADLGIDNVLADVLPGQKAAKVKELQTTGKKVGMDGAGRIPRGTRGGMSGTKQGRRGGFLIVLCYKLWHYRNIFM